MSKIFTTAIEISAIAATIAFFMYQRNQQDKAPSYEGNEVAIARPIRLEDTQYRICQTTKVSDGDTIAVDCDGEKLKLRFCGIDAPESKQPLGTESKALMMKLTDNKQVMIRPIEKDKYGRTVAEVEVKDDRKLSNGEYEILFVNAEILKAGLAYHYKQYSANCPNRDRIIEAEKFAKDKKLGVWDGGDYQKPWDYRHAKK
jgi:micrococcal nuclease